MNMCLDQSPIRYLFLHVPKTAGSMFRAIVAQNFDGAAAVENPYLSEMAYSTRQIDRLFYLYPYRFFLGHVFRLNAGLNACGSTLKLIAFSRDPVEKAFSAYNYLRCRNMTNSSHPVKSKSFIEMVEYVLKLKDFDSFDLDTSQTDWLVGAKGASVSVVQNAVETGRLAFFPTEEFDLACLILEQLYPGDFKDCSYAAKINASEKKEEISPEERAAAERLPWIAKDRELHAFARENVRVLSEQLFVSHEELHLAMEDFGTRCREKAQGRIPSLKDHRGKKLLARTFSAIKAFKQ